MVHCLPCCLCCICACCITPKFRACFAECAKLSETDIHKRGLCRYKDGNCVCQDREAFIRSIFFCTVINPCNCLAGFRSTICHEKYQPSPRLGLIIFCVLRFIIFSVYLYEELEGTEYRNGTITLHDEYSRLPEEYKVPIGDKWRILEPEFKEKQDYIVKRTKYLARVKFCCSALNATLLGTVILLHLILLCSAIWNSYRTAYAFVILIPLPLVTALIYQPIQYTFLFNSTYNIEHKEKHEVYNVLLWQIFWNLSTILTIYEVWLIIWFRKRVIQNKLEAFGIREISSTDFSTDVGVKMHHVDEIKEQEKTMDESYPTMGNASYSIAQNYFHTNMQTVNTPIEELRKNSLKGGEERVKISRRPGNPKSASLSNIKNNKVQPSRNSGNAPSSA